MGTKRRSDPKANALHEQGCLHPHPDAVADPLFGALDFFDRRDLVQVKYEMLRSVRVDGQAASSAARSFGLSRASFYQAQAALQREGLAGLLPKKRGPRGAHKLGAEVVDYLRGLLSDTPSLSSSELAARVQQRFALQVHPRSIERALARAHRQQKKRP